MPETEMPDVFVHVRIIVGMMLGLSLAKLVNGMTAFVEHPRRQQIYPIHIGWTVFMLVSTVHFWWYEFALVKVQVWTFGLYFFVLGYAMLFVAIASLLYPDTLHEFAGFRDYFDSRRRWFYGLLTVMFVVDAIDTATKGTDHLRSLGWEYPIRQVLFIVGSLIAIFVANRVYQTVFVSIAVVYQVVWIFRIYDILR
jgi:hypothetical protein